MDIYVYPLLELEHPKCVKAYYVVIVKVAYEKPDRLFRNNMFF